MTTILFVWTIVAAHGDRHAGTRHFEWRVLAEFSSPAACERGIEALGLKKDFARCILK